MNIKQPEYIISAKYNEYYKILAIIKHRIKEGGSPLWIETLQLLERELEENEGENVTNWQYNMIISILLDYVPEDVKKDY